MATHRTTVRQEEAMNADRALLRIRLFRNLELTRDSEVLAEFPTRRSAALFAKLVLDEGRISTRDALAELFWGDRSRDKARCCLRTELWRVRQVIESGGVARGTYLIVRKHSVAFNATANYELDVEQFTRKLATPQQCDSKTLTLEECDALRDAVALYRGDLLEALDAEWCAQQRETLRLQYITALELLMRYHATHREWDLACRYGQRLLSLDPFQEHIHLVLMRCHYLKGNRPAAVSQYLQCRKLLAEELGVSPMEKTEQVYRAMLAKHGSDNIVMDL